MILTFERKKLLEIISSVETGTGHIVPYTGDRFSCPVKTTPGLLLVGDEGVYLLGNEASDPNNQKVVAYANEANTKRMGIYEYRQFKEASFGGDDGVIFLDLEEVKSTLLQRSIPFIDLEPESYALGSVDSLDELYESPVEKSQQVLQVDDVEEIVDADGSDGAEEENNLMSWRKYLAYTQVPLDFAVKQMGVEPETYEYNDYYLPVNISMNPENLWANCELRGYGELGLDQVDFSYSTYEHVPLCQIDLAP